MEEQVLTEDEEWAIESLMRNLIYAPNVVGNVDLERRFYSKMLAKYGLDFTNNLISRIHEEVCRLIPEVAHAKML